jgi:hypothetical protein
MIQPDLIMDVFDGNQGNQADERTKGSNTMLNICLPHWIKYKKIKRVFSESESGSLFWGCL